MNKEELEEFERECAVLEKRRQRKRFVKSFFIPIKKPSSAFGIVTELIRDCLWQWFIRNPGDLFYMYVKIPLRRLDYFILNIEYPDSVLQVDKYFPKLFIRDNYRVLTGHRIVCYCDHCEFNDHLYSMKDNHFVKLTGKGSGVCMKCDNKDE